MYQPDTQTFAPSTLLVRTAGTPDGARAARHRDDPRARSESADRSRADAGGDPRRDDRAAAAQRDADRTVRRLALVIATVGVAGVLAFSVSQRTNELGIRVALGAERGTILRMILGEGACDGADRPRRRRRAGDPAVALLNGLLFGVEPVDPPTIAMAAVAAGGRRALAPRGFPRSARRPSIR